MKTTNALSFYCRESKKDSKGFAPIELCIIINGKRTVICLPRKERPDEFRKETGKATSEITAYLNEIRRNTNSAQTSMLEQGIPVTADRLKEYLRTGGIRSYTLDDLFGGYIETVRKRYMAGDITKLSCQKYEVIAERFKAFKSPETEASSITSSDILLFMAELKKENGQSTVCTKMTRLRSMFLSAFQSGKIKAFPFNGVHYRRPAPVIDYLSLDEILSLAALYIDIPRLKHVRDLFIFQCGTGLSYADLSLIGPDDMKTVDGVNYIQKKRKKTAKEFTAVVLPLAMGVWRTYSGVLPLLSNQRYNGYLKELADLGHIGKNLTTHMARRSYATYLLNSGVSISSVSKALGHSSTKITERHYAHLENSTVIDEISSRIFGDVGK